ncbi:hypothetical protein LTR91_008279 [Friedmanniomyces endolithicus]|uniref:Protein kinase domain-containing protein n=1 Tax=Friedmanniomyces endolithicus TaxID=329885 RepID=A0AAN6QV29_9PEZI|nr:hypothetical protein LTR35_001200 [Friedmanniomyces endolithicus]KAK0296554.1 hypothetical protein LTS00_004879 [Friedmanniomyces endolithicus]KAK0324706.1 hypothetical protein LTR82_004411 [Friedmanniomyces endolithicus]KAK0932181.1 hypothetical protein LTR57_000401 [Friedmanniomyces endolithicus]KAK0992309.1 hypothetical protein LTR91_008279 [Friedmanniomyces endolithicus]
MAEQPPPTEHTAPTSHPTTTVNGHPRAHSAEEAAEAAETAETAGSIDSPSHGISINLPDLVTGDQPVRPQPIKRMSAPTTPQISPIRQHKRAPSKSRPVKETLDAHSYYGSGDDDGAAVHRINQYIIKQEIGRGSFGAVHLAVDQYGGEYAVKEFSKSRLRKRAQSNLLRRPQDSNQRRRSGHLAAGLGFNSPLFRLSSSEKLRQEQQQQQQHQQHGDQPTESSNNSLELIKQEIAIMKKLNHPNLVALLEVLDDPQEDSLYMVLEMCKKGVVMQVGLDERADPYPDDICRTWFRDMILGIEYLHAHGIIHRDIKPDNCLITSDDVLKIVDFGVSEMFAKDQDMATTKSAGSPAFMPPELCVARHGPVSGKAADMWSMGVTLYCLRYGHIPFQREGLLELYESIRADEVPLEEEGDAAFADMMRKLLEKDPERRMTMAELREHPWVTESGTDPLLPASENCAELVDPPTEGEVANAITGNMAHLMIVMKAVKRFKEILHRKRPSSVQGLFGRSSRVVAPPGTIGGSQVRSGRSQEREKATPQSSSGGQQDDVANADFGNESERQQHRAQGMEPGIEQRELAAKDHEPETNKDERRTTHHENDQRTPRAEDHAKGHAHDPLTDTLFLDVGPGGAYVLEGEEGGEELDHGGVGTEMENSAPQHVISESPPEVATNIYETAYQEEIKRILSEREKGDGEEKGNGDGEEGEGAAGGLGIHLNRRVDHRGDIRGMLGLRASKGGSTAKDKLSGLLGGGSSGGGFARLVQKAKEQSGIEGGEARDAKPESSEDSEEAPLQPPRLDGAGGGEAERTDGEEEESQMGQGVPATSVKAHAQAQAQVDVQAHLDAASGAMPDVPGGFPASTGLGSQTAGDGKGTR